MNYEKCHSTKLHWQDQFRSGPANLGLMTGFVCDGGGPIVTQIATAINMAVGNTAPGFPFRMFNSQQNGTFASRRDAPCRTRDKSV
jgi:hypothetical protein